MSFDPGVKHGKRCFVYCGDDRCDCDAGPRGSFGSPLRRSAVAAVAQDAKAQQALDLDALEQIARAATPGPWQADDHDDIIAEGRIDIGGMTGGDTSCREDRKNAVFVATFDPPTILALVARIRAAEAQVQEVRDLVADPYADGVTPRGGVKHNWWEIAQLQRRRLKVVEARERAVLLACDDWSTNGHVLLMAGEMEKQELRSVRACLDGFISTVRRALTPPERTDG